jgi:hypothetical protein
MKDIAKTVKKQLNERALSLSSDIDDFKKAGQEIVSNWEKYSDEVQLLLVRIIENAAHCAKKNQVDELKKSLPD